MRLTVVNAFTSQSHFHVKGSCALSLFGICQKIDSSQKWKLENGLSLCNSCKAVCVIHRPQRLYFAWPSIHRYIYTFRNVDIRDRSVIDGLELQFVNLVISTLVLDTSVLVWARKIKRKSEYKSCLKSSKIFFLCDYHPEISKQNNLLYQFK